MDPFDFGMIWIGAVIDLLAGQVIGGACGWYIADRYVIGHPGEYGVYIGASCGILLAAMLSLKYGALSDLDYF